MLNKLFGALGWFGSLLVFAAVGVWLMRPDLEPLRRTLALAGLGCILLYGAGHWRQAARSFERRQTRYGALAGTGLVFGLVALVALNYVLARQNTRWDLTAAQQFPLNRFFDEGHLPRANKGFDGQPPGRGRRDDGQVSKSGHRQV